MSVVFGVPVCNGKLHVLILLPTDDLYQIDAEFDAVRDDPWSPVGIDEHCVPRAVRLKTADHYLPDGESARYMRRVDLSDETLARIDRWLQGVAEDLIAAAKCRPCFCRT